LWLVQECRRTWALEGQGLSYDDLTGLAASARPFRSIVDTDSPDFMRPGGMPTRMAAYCQRTRQPVPESKGEYVRCALESLALKYRWVLERTERMLGRKLDPIHIVGGGTQNKLLCQLTADATGRKVVAGPIEATAIVNVLVQAMGAGVVGSLEEARQTVRNSSNLLHYQPRENGSIEAAYRLFTQIAQ
jgi:rhamnulokinase